jgi:uncharacterized protein involved in outer membrane biogenesis
MNTERSAGQILKDVLRHRIFIISIGAVVFYTLVGFFLLPYIIEKTLPGSLQKNLNCTVDVGKVRFNPFLFKLEINDFDLKEKTGAPVVGFDRLFVDFETVSLFRWAWTFQHVILDNPSVNIAMTPDGNLNLAKLIPPGETETKTTENLSEDAATPVRMLLHDIRINNGEITFTDNRVSKPAVAKLTPLNLELNDFSTLPERKGPYSLAAKMPGGTQIRWTGEITLAPIQSKGLVEMSNISVENAWQFFRDTMRIAPPAGRIDVRTQYQLDLGSEVPKLVLDGIDILLSGLALAMEGDETPAIALKKLHLSESRFDLEKQQLDIGKLLMADGRVNGTMGIDGQLQLQKMFKPQTGQKEDAGATIEKQAPASETPAKPWVVNLNEFLLDNIHAEYMDQRREPDMVAGVDNIRVQFAANAEIGGAVPKIIVKNFSSRLGVISAGFADAEPDLRLDALLMEGGRFDLGAMQFTMDSMGLEGGHVNVVRGTDGAINLSALAPPTQAPTTAVEEKPDIAETEGPELQFLVDHIYLKDFSTSFSDHTVQADAPVIRLEAIHAALTGVDGKSPMDFSAGFRVKEGGQFTATGIIDPTGPMVQAELELADLQIPTFQPYVNRYANIYLQSGTLSTRGQFGFKGEGLKPALSFMGNMEMSDFWFSRPDFSDEQNGLKKLTVSKIDFTLSPDTLHIADVQLIGSSGKIVIDESRKVNFALMAREQAPDENSVAPSPVEDSDTGTGFPVRIDRIKISDSKLEFSDLSLRPQFATKIHNLSGVVTGISTSPDARARLTFNGDVDKYGDAKIGGEIAMADPKRFTDITMAFRNIEMNTMTPYSGRFAGRRIDSGRLSLNLEYKIKNSQLLGENTIILDRLTLGDRVESPDAVSLPLDLAIAILEDQDGRIDIGLPVRGNLEDPEFSYGHLIWQALVNVIKKIITSPFRALGGLFGDGMENPNSVAFAPGSFTVSAPEREKLEKLASVLTKRPQLQLMVQGRYSVEQDGEELRKLLVLRKLSAALGLALQPEENPGPADYTGSDTQNALREMFIERFAQEELETLVQNIEDQTKEKGAEAQDPTDVTETPDMILAKEMFNRLVETASLPEAELTALALSRAEAVRALVIESGSLPPERLGAKAPESLPSGETIAASLSLEAMK